MIDPADLRGFVGLVTVDLSKLGENNHQQYATIATGSKNKSSIGKLRFAIDVEDCLDRWYGGYFSDWACGGEWNRAIQFCELLVNAFNLAHIDIIVFFDGTLKEHKKMTTEYNDFRQRTISVIKHIRTIATPPPKIWWLPPSGTRTCIRNALRNLNISIVQTVHDHTMEIIEYYRDHKLDGILGEHPDYIIANIQHYFSSHNLRLSYKGSLETKEFLVSKLLTNLSLTSDHLPFVAAFLGGYILLTESMLKSIYQKVNIDYTLEFEGRVKRIAEVVRNSPTNEIDEFIRHLSLAEWAEEIKQTVEYYQRRGQFAQMKYVLNNKKKPMTENCKEVDLANVPLASETSDHDELARNILKDVTSLVDECELVEGIADFEKLTLNEPNDVTKKEMTVSTTKNSKPNKPNNNLVMYSIPIEVLKTALNRHQRGIMDFRIYQLLTKKQIILPQILEDEHYRDLPFVNLFYRPARQMIYALIFNMYHQKYLCSKKEHGKNELPDIIVSEWIWSPQNQYKKPELVKAVPLPWAVPTIQRLWFGTVFEDKQRRMKAFLTIMRSDSPLMLNRGYVPQHMLTMACVLRYIVTHPDRNILSRQELDAFLAVAFSPHLINVEYTQDLILPGVNLRGVYLASLFMQGVETASLANDACGIPLPWTMTNPWLFFDGKLFHLKLRMSTMVHSLRELCDDHFEIVLKIERFRKAILEDVEHYLSPAHMSQMEVMYRSPFLPNNLTHSYGNKNQMHSMANISPLANGTSFYNSQPHSYFPNLGNNIRQSNMTRGGGNVGRRINNPPQLVRQTNSRQTDYQLKVGGVVVGSWAGGVPNKPIGGGYIRYPRAGIINNRRQAAPLLNIRTHRSGMGGGNSIVGRTIARNMYAGKVQKNRKQRRTKDKKSSVDIPTDEKVYPEVFLVEKLNEDKVEADQTMTKEYIPEEFCNGLAAEENAELKGIESIPSVQSNGEAIDIKLSNIKSDVSERSAITNNNIESIVNLKETNGSVGGKNKKKNKKGKSGANNENGINKEEIEECEGQAETAVQI